MKDQDRYDASHAAFGFALGIEADAIPADVRRRASLLLLDTLGVGIAAAPMEAGRIARETAHRFYAAGDADASATLLFDGRRASIPGAAFAFASQTDNLDAHDGFNPVKGHIGVAMAPALIALAEHLPQLSGRDALAALVIGYEIAGRAGLALHATVADYHTSGAWNALGVAAMAARLREVSPEVARQALGIAEYHGPRSQMMREIAHPTMLHDGSGMGAFVGLSALLMAELGFTGAPAITVEGEESRPFWADLGTRWLTREQYIKPYPVCRWAHAAIDAAHDLVIRHDLSAEDIVGIRIGSFRNAVALFPAMPRTTSEAQYSLPFAVAQMIVRRRIGVTEISGEGLADPQVARLVDATECVVLADHEARFPEHRSAEVWLTLGSGEVLHSGPVEARGGVERPFSEADILAKFAAFAGPGLSQRRTSAISEAALGLDEAGTRFSDLARHLWAPPHEN